MPDRISGFEPSGIETGSDHGAHRATGSVNAAIHADVEDAQRWEVVGSRGTRRWPLVGLVGLIGLLVVGSLFRSGGKEEGAESLAETESVESLDDFLATTSTSQPAETQEISSGTQSSDNSESARGGADDPQVDAAAEIVGPGLGEPMILIAQQLRFRATRFYASDTAVVTDDLGSEFDDFAVDSSGTWLAAQTFDRRTRERTLWAGPIDGQLRPQAVDIDGFAWHDTLAGQLAFVALDDAVETFFTLDMELASADPIAVAVALGPVMSWGEWGFLSNSFDSGGRAWLANPGGEVVVSDIRGTPAGVIPGLGAVISPAGARDQPLAFDLVSGTAAPIEWLSDFQHVWRVVQGGKDGLFAVHASHFEERRHEVLIVTPTGVIVDRFWTVGGSIAMHWTRDGSRFMFVRDDGESRTSLVVYEVDGAETEVDLRGIDPKSFRIRVAVPRP